MLTIKWQYFKKKLLLFSTAYVRKHQVDHLETTDRNEGVSRIANGKHCFILLPITRGKYFLF